MKFNKKVLAAAILGAIAVSGSAFAAPLTTVEKIYAKEIKASAAAPVVLTGDVAEWEIGYNFTNNEVKYVRAELTGPAIFTAGTTTSMTAGADNIDFVTGAVNGAGTNVLSFAIANDPLTPIGIGDETADTLLSLGNISITGTGGPISLTVSLYDQASQAQNGGDLGKINSASYDSTVVASFADSFRLVATAREEVADVAADPSFTAFVVNAPTTATAATLATGVGLALIDPDGPGAGSQGATLTAAGAEITIANVINAPANARYNIAGEFGFAEDLATPPAAFRPNVLLNGTAVTAGNVLAGGNLRFPYAAAAGAFVLNVDGDTKIPEASYTLSLVTPTNSLDTTNYNAPVVAPIPVGSIVRNGAEMRAPFVQVPPAFQSRLVLNNYSNQDVDYEISVLGEDNNTITTDADKLKGTIKANSVFVIDELNTVLTGFTKDRRGAISVALGATDANVEGLYQILNRDAGVVTNYTLVRPGQD